MHVTLHTLLNNLTFNLKLLRPKRFLCPILICAAHTTGWFSLEYSLVFCIYLYLVCTWYFDYFETEQTSHTNFPGSSASQLHVARGVHAKAGKRSIRRFVITEKAPTRAFSWLKAATTAFTFKTLLRHYAKKALTPQFLNVKLGPRRKGHKGRAGWLAHP